MIFDCNDKWSLYNESSLLNKINNSNDFVNVDSDTLEIIKASILYSKNTDGFFDITTAKFNLIWKEAIKSKKLPKVIKSSAGDRKIIIKGNSVKVLEPIDFGGIAKGFILDKLVGILNGVGIINLGGTIHVFGSSIVGIRNPFKPMNDSFNSDYVIKLNLDNESIVTSGKYEQEFVKDGISFSHIINPKTGYPCCSDLISVSLVGNNACMMDAYATAIFNMNLEDSVNLLKKNNLGGVFIFKDGNMFITDNLKGKVVV